MKKIVYALACACMMSGTSIGAELNTQMKAYIESLKAEILKNEGILRILTLIAEKRYLKQKV